MALTHCKGKYGVCTSSVLRTLPQVMFGYFFNSICVMLDVAAISYVNDCCVARAMTSSGHNSVSKAY